ncbi:hypothetical protein G6F42_023029 [Rhizopus arrhizus]|nr:hypothetical protein G6F42_023029 [Rhizopus arrhizus]
MKLRALLLVNKKSAVSFWRVNQPVIIRHVQTGKLLHSHDIALSGGENEVSAFEGTDDNDKWAVSFD